jgi:diguanylate cyclase (GGDEF)-like protein
MRRQHLRRRVLLLTSAFTLALFAITGGLVWRGRLVQARWSRLVAVEMKAVTLLEGVIRAQNGFYGRYLAGQETPARYRMVTQLLAGESLQGVDTASLRGRMKAFQAVIEEPDARRTDLDALSAAIVADAQQIISDRRREIARQLPSLEREATATMWSGLAVAWIIALLSFAAVQTTLRRVVKPLEDLSAAARLVARGNLTAHAPIAGDHEIAELGLALNQMADELRAHARTDELTSLPNFRAFGERIDEELERADRYPARFGVLVLDLDRFKKYNDTFGHAAGNDALQRVAKTIRETVRTVDFPARYGGVEFAVVLPRVDPQSLQVIAERIRSNIEALPAPPDGSSVTVSIGGALYPDDGRDRAAIFEKADARLYEAKKKGRNRVVGPDERAGMAAK